VPNFIKIGQSVAEIWRFNGFQNGGRPPSWIFEIKILYRSERLRDQFCIIVFCKEISLNFCKDRSNRCGDIAIFVIFKPLAVNGELALPRSP